MSKYLSRRKCLYSTVIHANYQWYSLHINDILIMTSQEEMSLNSSLFAKAEPWRQMNPHGNDHNVAWFLHGNPINCENFTGWTNQGFGKEVWHDHHHVTINRATSFSVSQSFSHTFRVWPTVLLSNVRYVLKVYRGDADPHQTWGQVYKRQVHKTYT